jgi:hypothetical protein
MIIPSLCSEMLVRQVDTGTTEGIARKVPDLLAVDRLERVLISGMTFSIRVLQEFAPNFYRGNQVESIEMAI